MIIHSIIAIITKVNKRLIITLAAFVFVAGTSIAVFFYARGLKFNPKNKTIEKTGLLLVKSRPDGAKLFLDNKLVTATPATVSGLEPGNYKITLTKDGYTKWEKEVPVQADFVTNLAALLISKTPELKPLTSTGAYSPVATAQQDKIAFRVEGGSKSGIGILKLERKTLPLIRNSANQIIEDTKQASYSAAKSIQWSPLGTELLVNIDNTRSYLIKIAGGGSENISLVEPEIIEQDWKEEEEEIKSLLANRFQLTDEEHKIATASATAWSPDEKKFLSFEEKDGKKSYTIRNFKKPLGVGEKEEYNPLVLNIADATKVTWYSDSEHLLLTNQKSIKIVDLDGTNLNTVYSSQLEEAFAVPFPEGDKIVILTKFKEDSDPNLYSLSLQ